jgi:hypothetical protein
MGRPCQPDSAMMHRATCEWRIYIRKNTVDIAPLAEGPAVILEQKKLAQRTREKTLGKRQSVEPVPQL